MHLEFIFIFIYFYVPKMNFLCNIGVLLQVGL